MGSRMKRVPAATTATLLLIALGPFVACADSTGPIIETVDLQVVEVPLETLSIRTFEAPTGRMIWIEGTVAEGIREDEALLAILTTSSGDTAEVPLPRSLCGSISNHYLCRQLEVTLRPGEGTAALHDWLASVDAALTATYVIENTIAGVVEVFSGATEEVKRRLRELPMIQVAENTGSGVVGADLPHDISRGVRLVVPARDNRPRAASARIRLEPGETVSIRYRQPDGSLMTASTIVPES